MKIRRWVLPVIALLLCVLVIVSISFISQNGLVAPASSSPMPLRQVVIDPGHGGEDGGAEVSNLIEKNINLQISKYLAVFMQEAGFEVILTRTKDVSIYDQDKSSLRNKKRSDILNRLKIANDNPNAIMISIHQNKFLQSKYSGAQMFYGGKNEWSQPLAESLQQSIVQLLQPNNNRMIKPITKSVYLINNAKTPAVLCECGFLSNPAEAAKLADETYQQQIAFAIHCGILNFYNSMQT